jgi:hypothetical protein
LLLPRIRQIATFAHTAYMGGLVVPKIIQQKKFNIISANGNSIVVSKIHNIHLYLSAHVDESINNMKMIF